MMNPLAWAIFAGAAILEVGGDALIRHGLRTQGSLFILIGFLVLGCYGIVVNMVRWEFSKLLGVYIAFFAFASVLAGRLVFREAVPINTWVGISLVIAGGLVIQFGPK